MKKLSLILIALLLCIALVACDGGKDTTAPNGPDTPGVDTPVVPGPGTDVEDDHVHTNKSVAAVASTCTAAGLTGFFGYFFGTAILANIVIGYVAEKAGWDWTFVLLIAACLLSVVLMAMTNKEEKRLLAKK